MNYRSYDNDFCDDSSSGRRTCWTQEVRIMRWRELEMSERGYLVGEGGTMRRDFARLWAIFAVANRPVDGPFRSRTGHGIKPCGNTACEMVVGIVGAPPRRNDLNLAPVWARCRAKAAPLAFLPSMGFEYHVILVTCARG